MLHLRRPVVHRSTPWTSGRRRPGRSPTLHWAPDPDDLGPVVTVTPALGVVLALPLVLLATAVLPSCSPAPPAGPPGRARVVRVIDGDTVVVDLRGQEVTVRLLGIDTPETHHPTRPVECHGPEASARLGDLLVPGTEVDLSRDVELHDIHGRLLAYVRRTVDGLDVNLTMASEGHADPLRIPPNVARAADISAAASSARTRGAGLWGHCRGPHDPDLRR